MSVSWRYAAPRSVRFGWPRRLLVYLVLMVVDSLAWWAVVVAAQDHLLVWAKVLASLASIGVAVIGIATFLWMVGVGRSLLRLVAGGLLGVLVIFLMIWVLISTALTLLVQRPEVLPALLRRPDTPAAVIANLLALSVLGLLIGVPRALRRIAPWSEVSPAWASRTTHVLAVAASTLAIGVGIALYAGYGPPKTGSCG